MGLWVLAAFFVVAGTNHFLNPGPYLAMMPPYLPWHEALIVVSGVAEIVGGLGILIPKMRWLAGWGLIVIVLVARVPGERASGVARLAERCRYRNGRIMGTSSSSRRADRMGLLGLHGQGFPGESGKLFAKIRMND